MVVRSFEVFDAPLNHCQQIIYVPVRVQAQTIAYWEYPSRKGRFSTFMQLNRDFNSVSSFFVPKSDDTRQKLPWFVAMGMLHLTYWYDRCHHFKKSTGHTNDNRAADLVALFTTGHNYIELADKISEDCGDYRRKCVYFDDPKIEQDAEMMMGRRLHHSFPQEGYDGLILKTGSGDEFRKECDDAIQQRRLKVMLP